MIKKSWSSYAQAPLRYDHDGAQEQSNTGLLTQAAVIHSIPDRWTFVFATNKTAARILACDMFAQSSTSISDNEVQDALFELANVTGGLMKTAIGFDGKFSIPSAYTMKDLFRLKNNSTQNAQCWAFTNTHPVYAGWFCYDANLSN